MASLRGDDCDKQLGGGFAGDVPDFLQENNDVVTGIGAPNADLPIISRSSPGRRRLRLFYLSRHFRAQRSRIRVAQSERMVLAIDVFLTPSPAFSQPWRGWPGRALRHPPTNARAPTTSGSGANDRLGRTPRPHIYNLRPWFLPRSESRRCLPRRERFGYTSTRRARCSVYY
jgi:hypothetical protein